MLHAIPGIMRAAIAVAILTVALTPATGATIDTEPDSQAAVGTEPALKSHSQTLNPAYPMSGGLPVGTACDSSGCGIEIKDFTWYE